MQNWFTRATHTPQDPIVPPQVPDSPSEILSLRRERDQIKNKLAVKPQILEARRKIKEVWEPRVAQLRPLLDEQQKKSDRLRPLVEGHPPAERRGNSRSMHCRDCQDFEVVSENLAALKAAMKFAEDNLASQKALDKRLTELFESVTGKDRKRLDEINKTLEAQADKHEPEKRIKIPSPPQVNQREPVRRLGFGSNPLPGGEL